LRGEGGGRGTLFICFILFEEREGGRVREGERYLLQRVVDYILDLALMGYYTLIDSEAGQLLFDYGWFMCVRSEVGLKKG